MMRNIKTRNGFEFWDKLNALPRYAFLLSPSGRSVQKFEDQAMGNWIDVHEALKIVDQAEERISDRQDDLSEVCSQLDKFHSRSHGIKNLSAIEERDDQLAAAQLKINELQQRLNAADQRIDELTAKTRVESVCRGSAALGTACGKCARCASLSLAASVKKHDGKIHGMIETVCGNFAIMIDEANAHYGWTFKKDPNDMWVSGRKATEAEMNAARAHAKFLALF